MFQGLHSGALMLPCSRSMKRIKVFQQALRPASFQVSTDIDVQAPSQPVRTAQSRVLEQLPEVTDGAE